LSEFLKNFANRDLIEAERFRDDAIRRRYITIMLVPLGTIAAFVISYVNIPIAIDAANWLYVLEKPDLVSFLKISPSALAGGGVATLLSAKISLSLMGRSPIGRTLVMFSFLYGILVPLLVSILIPTNLFFLQITGTSRIIDDTPILQSLTEMFLSTPLFVLVYVLTGWKQALLTGITIALIAWVLFRVMSPDKKKLQVFSGIGISWIVGIGFGFAVIIGPIGLLEFLFNLFQEIAPI
jgi:hypothetical protein